MTNKFNGLVLIIIGIILLIATLDFTLKFAAIIFAIYLIFSGMRLRNPNNILFYKINTFFGQVNRRDRWFGRW